MRMWMVRPEMMCQKHLLGEHVEIHMLAGTLKRGKSIALFIDKGLLEPSSLAERHDKLAEEMLKRGFRHLSPLGPETGKIIANLGEKEKNARVDLGKSSAELCARCPECRKRLAET